VAQVGLLLGLLALPGLWRWPIRWALPLAGGLTALLALIHEGTVCLVGPAYVTLFWLRGARKAAIVTSGIVASSALGIALLGSITPDQRDLLLPTMTAGGMQTPADALIFQSFRDLVIEESWAPLHRALWLVRALAVPLLLTVLVGSWRLGWIWTVLLMTSSPLFVIGHDWGRFATYLWIVALAVTVTTRPRLPAPSPAHMTRVAAVLLIMTTPAPLYLIYGVTDEALVIGLVASAAAWATRRRFLI
jgi:hypothetical protein